VRRSCALLATNGVSAEECPGRDDSTAALAEKDDRQMMPHNPTSDADTAISRRIRQMSDAIPMSV
jgi:hypothetical protein